MSTRTNVLVKFGETTIYLYRHCDGYPAECGAAIAEALAKARGHSYSSGDAFMQALLSNRYEATSYGPERPVYEFTTDYHGDIEHVYEIKFGDDGVAKIRHKARPDDWHKSGEGFNVDKWCRTGAWINEAQFVALVNADRKACNERLAELRATSKVYADCSDYPMLEAVS